MKVLLDIKDNKVGFVMELLKNLSFVKAQPLSSYKADVFQGIHESIQEMNLIKEGKLTGRNAEDLFDEL
jgi:hypothetical protein